MFKLTVLVAVLTLSAFAMAGSPQVKCADGKLEDGSACSCPQDSCKSCITSDKATSCTACDAGTLLVAGSCVQANVCHKNLIKGTDTACKCPKHCLTCHIAEGGASKCITCTNRRHLHGETCVDSCPTHMTVHGHKKVGRICAHPFLCFNGKVQNAKGSIVPSACKCPDKNCQRCQFNAGTGGSQCTRCKNKKYLSGSECVNKCSSTTTAVGIGKYGRMCTKAGYICNNGRESNFNVKCKCQTPNCGLCQVTSKAEKCMRCGNFKFLHENQCTDSCPAGLVEQKPARGVGYACLSPKE